MKKTLFKILPVCFLLAFGAGQVARADCANPAGVEGEMIFNYDYALMQFCDGTDWISMAAKVNAQADLMPDAFSFTDQTGVATSTQISSNTITLAGMTGSASVSVTGDGSPQININGGGWVSSGTITNGQTLQVRLTSGSSFNQQRYANVVVGGSTAEVWIVTTTGPDTTPDPFNFTDLTDVPLQTQPPSNIITISGIDSSTPVSISGQGNPHFSINGGPWVTSGSITNSSTLQLLMAPSNNYSTTFTATINVGGVTDDWSVTTEATCAPDGNYNSQAECLCRCAKDPDCTFISSYTNWSSCARCNNPATFSSWPSGYVTYYCPNSSSGSCTYYTGAWCDSYTYY